MAIKRAHQLEQARQRRMIKRIRDGDDSIVEEWNHDRFERSR